MSFHSGSLRSRYTQLAAGDYQDQEDEEEEANTLVEVPYVSILLAGVLAVLGIAMFTMAWLHFTQRLLGKERAEIAFSFLGVLTFLPGAYHLWIAFCAWRRYPGYSFDQIPQW